MGENHEHLNRIITQCKQGDNKAREELYNMFSSRMMALCYRYLRIKEDAEDVLIDGFITVFERIGTYKDGNFYGWLRTVMTNKCLAFLNKEKMFAQKTEEYFTEADTHDITENEERFTKKDLNDALDRLPKALRTVFNMSVIDGYSHNEICDMLGVEKNTVKTSLYKAKVLLRKFLYETETKKNSSK